MICNQNDKNLFRKPVIVQIVPKIHKEVYQIDLTVLPLKLQSDDNDKYLLCIIDTF